MTDDRRKGGAQTHAADLQGRAGAGAAELYRIVSSHERITTTGGAIVAIRLHCAPADEGAFIDGWNAGRTEIARNPGYLASTLHRALDPDNQIRFVELTRFTTTDAVPRRRTGVTP